MRAQHIGQVGPRRDEGRQVAADFDSPELSDEVTAGIVDEELHGRMLVHWAERWVPSIAQPVPRVLDGEIPPLGGPVAQQVVGGRVEGLESAKEGGEEPK